MCLSWAGENAGPLFYGPACAAPRSSGAGSRGRRRRFQPEIVADSIPWPDQSYPSPRCSPNALQTPDHIRFVLLPKGRRRSNTRGIMSVTSQLTLATLPDMHNIAAVIAQDARAHRTIPDPPCLGLLHHINCNLFGAPQKQPKDDKINEASGRLVANTGGQ
jgi:hypothetical protein